MFDDSIKVEITPFNVSRAEEGVHLRKYDLFPMRRDIEVRTYSSNPLSGLVAQRSVPVLDRIPCLTARVALAKPRTCPHQKPI